MQTQKYNQALKNTSPQIEEYLSNFGYRIRLKAGYTWSAEFQEFNKWCEENLGTKYKDWFLAAGGNRHYILYVKNNKWASFLALRFAELVDNT